MSSSMKLLILDDDETILKFFKRILKGSGYQIYYYKNSTDAVKKIESEDFDCIVTDLKIDELNGIDILKISKNKNPLTEVVIMTGYGTIESAVEAMQLGAYDYLTKPLDISKTKLTIERALERISMRKTIKFLKNEIRSTNRNGLVASSTSMKRVLELAEAVAQTESTVLITGESGVGKEVVARYIHGISQRAEKAFISVNCSAIPESLIESELFGYIEGAFTGAVKTKVGLFEEANKGTLFLDEIGELPFSIQAKLLRVLQNGEMRRVGDTKNIILDVRVIAATNKNLHQLVDEGKFREDLYYRLNVIPIDIPSLRSRKEDIVPLINLFVDKYSLKMKKIVKDFTADAIALMISYDWPGNVRELENMVERIVALSDSEKISELDVIRVFALDKGIVNVKKVNKVDVGVGKSKNSEVSKIVDVLMETRWNYQKAAKKLGISRTTLWRKIKKYGISK